jgi:hypothetical protein
MLNPREMKSTPRGSLFRLFIKKNLRSEIQNSLTIGGLPPHKLVVKVNCIVLLIRNKGSISQWNKNGHQVHAS